MIFFRCLGFVIAGILIILGAFWFGMAMIAYWIVNFIETKNQRKTL